VLDDGTYISWWPVPGTQRNRTNKNLQWDADAIDGNTYSHDIGANGESQGPDQVIHISGLNEVAIKSWWPNYKKNRKYNSRHRNCSTTVWDALLSGLPPEIRKRLNMPTSDKFWPTVSPDDVSWLGQFLAGFFGKGGGGSK
jgi:hypothetical protein